MISVQIITGQLSETVSSNGSKQLLSIVDDSIPVAVKDEKAAPRVEVGNILHGSIRSRITLCVYYSNRNFGEKLKEMSRIYTEEKENSADGGVPTVYRSARDQ